MIQIQEHPLLLSHPHPQLVAVKSLILFSSEISVYSVSYAGRQNVLPFMNAEMIQKFHTHP